MIPRQLVVIEIEERGVVSVAYINHGRLWVGEVDDGRFAPHDGHWLNSEQDTAGEKLIFMRAARVGEDR